MLHYLAWIAASVVGSVAGALLSVSHEGYGVAGHPETVTWARDHLTFTLDVGVLALAQALVLKWQLPRVTAAFYVLAAVGFSIVYGLLFPEALALVSPPLEGPLLLAALALPWGVNAAVQWLVLREAGVPALAWIGASTAGAAAAAAIAGAMPDELLFHAVLGLGLGAASGLGLARRAATEARA